MQQIEKSSALFPYQETGADFLARRKRAVLADEPGLGKTPQAIVACDLIGARRVLVICPAVVTENWRREFLRWQRTFRPVEVAQSGDLLFPDGAHIISYDRARIRATLNALIARTWDAVIVDEAHFVKTPSAARSEAVRMIADGATYSWGLTGTPMPGYADELWHLLRCFGPEALGSPAMAYWPWRKRYCVEVPLGKTGRSKIVGIRHVEELRARLASVMLRRKKVDVLKDLPALREEEMLLAVDSFPREMAEIARSPETRALLRAIAEASSRDDVEKAASLILQSSADDSISRLRRLTAGIKAAALGPMLADELAGSDEKLVVMCWHTETIESLAHALEDFRPVQIHGGTPTANRQKAVDLFQTDPTVRVFLGQIQAAGTGITLTAASNLVFAEMSWTPGDNHQAAMRVHRVGQTRPVLIRYATLAGTIDEAVIRTLRRKTQDIRSTLEASA